MYARKGVSPIIATVLLVILTLVAIGILAAFVIPFVNDSFKGSKECFEVLGKVKFDSQSLYNCRVVGAVGAPSRTGFSVRMDTGEAFALKVVLTKNGRGDTYPIENGTASASIHMLGAPLGQPLEVPFKGGVRTYVANDWYDRVEINAVLKSGKVCETREVLTLSDCADPTIVAALTAY